MTEFQIILKNQI